MNDDIKSLIERADAWLDKAGYDDEKLTHLLVWDLRNALQSQGWQDIECAPRDGTNILLSDGKGCCSGSWYSDKQREQEYVKTVKEGDIYKEVERDHGYFTFDTIAIEYPVYWQYPPAPPTTGEGE